MKGTIIISLKFIQQTAKQIMMFEFVTDFRFYFQECLQCPGVCMQMGTTMFLQNMVCVSIHRNLQFTEYLNTPSIYQLTVVNSRSIQIDICRLHCVTLCCRVNTTRQKHGAEWHITFRWGVMKTRSVSQYCETGVFLLYFSTNILSHGIQECIYIDIHN